MADQSDVRSSEARGEAGSVSLAQVARDRAEAAGFPPDSGPEQRVIQVNPSLLRGRPFQTLGLVILPFLPLVAKWLMFQDMTWEWTGWISGGLLVISLLTLLIQWLFYSYARSMRVTNKRVVERRGLLSKRMTEVLHEHIRSVSVEQTVLQRIFNTGLVEISSAANADVEVRMRDIPQPHKVKEVIDLYRDQLG